MCSIVCGDFICAISVGDQVSATGVHRSRARGLSGAQHDVHRKQGSHDCWRYDSYTKSSPAHRCLAFSQAISDSCGLFEVREGREGRALRQPLLASSVVAVALWPFTLLIPLLLSIPTSSAAPALHFRTVRARSSLVIVRTSLGKHKVYLTTSVSLSTRSKASCVGLLHDHSHRNHSKCWLDRRRHHRMASRDTDKQSSSGLDFHLHPVSRRPPKGFDVT